MADRRLTDEPRLVRHQLAKRDRCIERIPRCEFRQDARHGRIKIEPALFDELHDRQVCEQLRYRADAIQRVGRGRDLPRGVGKPEPARPNDPLIVDQSDGKGGQGLRLDLGGDPGLELSHKLGVSRLRPNRSFRSGRQEKNRLKTRPQPRRSTKAHGADAIASLSETISHT